MSKEKRDAHRRVELKAKTQSAALTAAPYVIRLAKKPERPPAVCVSPSRLYGATYLSLTVHFSSPQGSTLGDGTGTWNLVTVCNDVTAGGNPRNRNLESGTRKLEPLSKKMKNGGARPSPTVPVHVAPPILSFDPYQGSDLSLGSPTRVTTPRVQLIAG